MTKREKDGLTGVAPKRKKRTVIESVPDNLNTLVEEIKNAESNIASLGKVDTPNVDPPLKSEAAVASAVVDASEDKRAELIRLSEDGEINQSVKHIQKASAKVIEKIHKQIEAKRMEKANAFITDLLISKFADLLGGLNAVASSDELESELLKDKLLKNDVEKIVGMITPYIPALGIVSGSIVVGKHVTKHYCDKIGDAKGPFEETPIIPENPIIPEPPPYEEK